VAIGRLSSGVGALWDGVLRVSGGGGGSAGGGLPLGAVARAVLVWGGVSREGKYTYIIIIIVCALLSVDIDIHHLLYILHIHCVLGTQIANTLDEFCFACSMSDESHGVLQLRLVVELGRITSSQSINHKSSQGHTRARRSRSQHCHTVGSKPSINQSKVLTQQTLRHEVTQAWGAESLNSNSESRDG